MFYEGPPTANGMPGVHHVEARVFKDLFPRFKTMKGYRVRRKAGWDCHGLPVEVAVEKELGLSGKKDIEAYGVAEFNARCRESVLRHVDAFEAMTERMGYWVDLAQAYRTMDPEYVESVWWSLKRSSTRACWSATTDQPVLPALRHAAVRPRARPARRVRDRHRPVGDVRFPVPRRSARGRRPARLDDHAVDAGLQHGHRRAPRRHVRRRGALGRAGAASSSPSRCSPGCSARAGTSSPGSPGPSWPARRTAARSSWWTSRTRTAC